MKSNTGKYLKVLALLWAGFLVVFVLVFMLVLRPLNKRRTDTENEYYRKIKPQADAALLASQDETKNRLKEQIRAMNERLGDFVIEPDNTSLTYEISNISTELGLQAFQVTPMGQSVAAFDNCNYVSGQYYEVGFTASFNQFAMFLNALERYRPAIFVDTFSITGSRQSGIGHKVGIKLAVLVAKNEKAKETEG